VPRTGVVMPTEVSEPNVPPTALLPEVALKLNPVELGGNAEPDDEKPAVNSVLDGVLMES